MKDDTVSGGTKLASAAQQGCMPWVSLAGQPAGPSQVEDSRGVMPEKNM